MAPPSFAAAATPGDGREGEAQEPQAENRKQTEAPREREGEEGMSKKQPRRIQDVASLS